MNVYQRETLLFVKYETLLTTWGWLCGTDDIGGTEGHARDIIKDGLRKGKSFF
jgi:hypothetical protein